MVLRELGVLGGYLGVTFLSGFGLDTLTDLGLKGFKIYILESIRSLPREGSGPG